MLIKVVYDPEILEIGPERRWKTVNQSTCFALTRYPAQAWRGEKSTMVLNAFGGLGKRRSYGRSLIASRQLIR